MLNITSIKKEYVLEVFSSREREREREATTSVSYKLLDAKPKREQRRCFELELGCNLNEKAHEDFKFSRQGQMIDGPTALPM